MAVVVVDQAEFSIIELTAPLDGLTRRYPIACSPLRGNLAARFVQSPSEPSGAFPGDIPEGGAVAAGEVYTGDLQIAAVDVALLERDIVAYGDHLGGAAAHVVIGAVHGGAARGIDPVEIDGAVPGVVVHRPDTGAGLHACLVTIRIILRLEIDITIHRESGV